MNDNSGNTTTAAAEEPLAEFSHHLAQYARAEAMKRGLGPWLCCVAMANALGMILKPKEGPVPREKTEQLHEVIYKVANADGSQPAKNGAAGPADVGA